MPRNPYSEKKANYPEFKQGYPEFKTGSQLVEYGNTAEQRGFGGGGSLKDYFKLTGTYQKDGDNYYFTNPINSLKSQIINSSVGLFDGIDDYAQSATSIAWEIGTTVNVWANFFNVTTTSYFIGDSLVSAGVRYDGTSFFVLNSVGAIVTVANWTKVDKIVKASFKRITGTNYEVYIDDILIGISSGTSSTTINVRLIGRRLTPTSFFFNGKIARVNMINSTNQKLVEYYINHQNGVILYDVSGNNNNATLFNTTSANYWVVDNLEPYYLNGCTIYSNGTNYIVVNGNNNYTISNYPKVGYFEAPFLIPKGVITKLVIPIDAKLNNYLPDGNYGFTELNALTATENIIIEKTENIINSLTVKI